jgi:hypothetical protein
MMANHITVQSKTFTLVERKRIQHVRSGKMGTNFYWKEIPKEFKKYIPHVKKWFGDVGHDDVLVHIGKRSAAGKYCYECGTTLKKAGTDNIHDCMYDDWYSECPICGREGTPICSFRWTMLRHKWLIEALADEGWTKKCIVDEYGDSYSHIEFLQEINTPIEYQACCEFS